MADGGLGTALKHLQDLCRTGAIGRLTDGELLERFVRRGEDAAESAFAALVERHGPMVLRACRDLLGDFHEAEDAFQATFLVLARRAGSIRRPELLANWLYGVAHRTARKARVQAHRRRSREARVDEMSAIEAVERGGRHDLAPEHREQAGLVHEELNALPEKQRAAIVLCCLEELTVEEASRRLRCTPDAVRGRLAQGRSRLRARLARRGIAVPPAALAAAFSTRTASAAVPPALRDATTRAAVCWIRGSTAAGAASGGVVALTKGVSRHMILSELSLPAAVLATVAAVGVGALTSGPSPQDEVKAPAAVAAEGDAAPASGPGPAGHRRLVEGAGWFLAAVDPGRGTVSLSDLDRKDQRGDHAIALVQSRGGLGPSGLTLGGLGVAADARITVDGRAADLARLRVGMRVAVELAPDRLTAAVIRAESPVRAGSPPPPPTLCILEGVDDARRTVTVTVGEHGLKLEVLRVPAGAGISLMDVDANGAARVDAVGLDGLRPGMPASLSLEVGEDGRLHVRSLMSARGKPSQEPPR